MSQEISDLNFNSDLQNFKKNLDTCNPIFPLRTHILLASHVPLHTNSLTSIMTSREKLFCLYLLCILFLFSFSLSIFCLFFDLNKKNIKMFIFPYTRAPKKYERRKKVFVFRLKERFWLRWHNFLYFRWWEWYVMAFWAIIVRFSWSLKTYLHYLVF